VSGNRVGVMDPYMEVMRSGSKMGGEYNGVNIRGVPGADKV
jgi:hypothetical protein